MFANILFIFLTLLSFVTAASTSPVKYIIVLMFENRSFDHFLGHLGLSDPRVDGLQNAPCIPEDPTNPSSPTACINFNAVDGGPTDPLRKLFHLCSRCNRFVFFLLIFY